MDFLYAMIGGLIVGALFGFVLQSGRFCMNSAFRDILLLKEFKLAKAVVIAIVVEMVGFGIFAAAGVITLGVKPFNVGGSIVGGLVFGIGMVLAAGCASGTTYRVGEGMMGSLVAAFGLTSGALATAYGLFKPAKDAIQSVTVGTKLTVFGEYDAVLTPVLMIIVGIVLAVVIFFFWGLPGFKKKREAGGPLIKTDDIAKVSDAGESEFFNNRTADARSREAVRVNEIPAAGFPGDDLSQFFATFIERSRAPVPDGRPRYDRYVFSI